MENIYLVVSSSRVCPHSPVSVSNWVADSEFEDEQKKNIKDAKTTVKFLFTSFYLVNEMIILNASITLVIWEFIFTVLHYNLNQLSGN